jgi:RNase P subunit RPR2
MNLDKSDEIQLSCEKCSTALSADAASRTILSDGHVHVFCQDCMRHMLIIRDGSLKL